MHAPDAEFPGAQHHVLCRVSEIEGDDLAPPALPCLGRHERDRGGRTRDVLRVVADRGELPEVAALGAHDERTRLLVLGARRATSGVDDPVERLLGDRAIVELPDGPLGGDGVPHVHRAGSLGGVTPSVRR